MFDYLVGVMLVRSAGGGLSGPQTDNYALFALAADASYPVRLEIDNLGRASTDIRCPNAREARGLRSWAEGGPCGCDCRLLRPAGIQC